MKNLVLLILFIFLTLPCIADEVLYLDKIWDEKASKILYEHVLKKVNMTSEQSYENFGYKLEDVRAVFYDLNGDGISEVLGFIDVPSSYSRDGASFYILQRKNIYYRDISLINAYPATGIHILETKTNNYCDVGVVVTIQHKYVVAKYNKQYYEYFFPN